MIKCDWCLKSLNEQNYHDLEWGVPLHDDTKHFEFLTLDTFQAGLSWATILNKRSFFSEAFDGFKAEKIVNYDQNRIDLLLQNSGIIRNRLKIESTINNARIFLEIQSKYGSFDSFIWQFTNGVPIINSWETMDQIPAKTLESDTMSRELKKLGFKFVGSTICYAYMQATGMVNDHLTKCFRYAEVNQMH